MSGATSMRAARRHRCDNPGAETGDTHRASMSPHECSMERSNGYEAVAQEFARRREAAAIGVVSVLRWASSLRAGGDVLDLGCGSGMPVAAAMDREGFAVFGVDGAPTLVRMFRERLPRARVVCEAVEDSRFFDRAFDGVLAIGLMFLLSATVQRALIHRVSGVLRPGGRFLFTSPAQECAWDDLLTGRASMSLGATAYAAVSAEAGLEPVTTWQDEGGNHYFDLRRL